MPRKSFRNTSQVFWLNDKVTENRRLYIAARRKMVKDRGNSNFQQRQLEFKELRKLLSKEIVRSKTGAFNKL